MSGRRSAKGRIEALFGAFARRVEEGGFVKSCPAGTVCVGLDADQEALRAAVARSLDRYAEAVGRHLSFANADRAASFARVVVSAIEGAYVRSRATRDRSPFREAGAWLAELAAKERIRPRS